MSFAAEAKDAQWVNQVFQKGKSFYEAGDYKSAVREWNSLDPYIDQYPSFQRVINYLKSQIANSSAAVKTKPPASAGTQSMMPDAVHEAFYRGKLAYQSGDWDGAIAQWDKIGPYLDPAGEESRLINKLKADHAALAAASRNNENLSAEKKAAITPPGDLKALMGEAQQKLSDQIQVMESRKQAIEKEAIFEQAWINSTFESGKTAYDSGQYDRAIEEWDKLIFKLGRDPQLKDQIEDLKTLYAQYKQTEVGYANATAAETSPSRPADDSMKLFLEQVETDLKNKTRELDEQGRLMQESQADQQRRVQDIFDKGKALHLKGEYKEAMDQWMLLSRYFENNAMLRSAFLSAQATAHSYEQANNSLRQLTESGTAKLRLPDGFFNYLEEAGHELSDRTRAAEAKREKTEQAVGSKRAEILQSFESGKALYADGKVTDAIAAWSRVVPWVEDAESVQTQLQQLEVNSQNLVRETRALREAEQRAAKNFTPPADFLKRLKEVNDDLKKQTQAATDNRFTLQQGLNEKQGQASNLFHKANYAQQAGKIDNAIDEWEKLVPYLDPLSEEKILIESLRQSQTDYTAAKRQYDEMSAKSRGKIEVPGELKAILVRTNGDLMKQASAAAAQRQLLETKRAELETEVRTAFEKGKASFQAGRLEDALEEWKKIIEYLDDTTGVPALIRQLDVNLADSRQAKGALDAASAKKEIKIEVPEELRAVLARTNDDLVKQADEAVEKRRALETKMNELETLVLSTYEKGKMSFQTGRLEDALTEWKKILDHIDDKSGVPALIRQLDVNLADLRQAKQAQEAAFAKKATKIEVAEDLPQMLQNALQKTTLETQRLQMERAGIEKELKERNEFVAATFEAGKKLAAEGKWQEAVYEWGKLKGYLDEASTIPASLQNLKQSLQDLEELKRSNAEFTATVYHDLKLPFTDEMTKLLNDMDATIRHNTVTAREERASMEKSLAEREAWVSTTFEKGKAYYEVGKYKEAIEFWSSLKTHLKDELKIQPLLAGLLERYENMVAAQKASEQAAAKKDGLFETPAELPKILSDMAAKLEAMHFEATSQVAKAEQIYSDRRGSVDAIFQKGDLLYQAGDTTGALREWSALPSYLQDENKVKTLLDNLKQSQQDLATARQAAADAQARQEARFAPPDGLTDLLLDAARKLDKETQVSELDRQRSEKVIADRQSSIQGVFAEGKAYYDQGKMNEAFLRWRSLLPSMTEEKELGEQLTKAEQSYQNYVNSKQQNQEALAKKSMKVVPPAELSQILDEVNRSLGDQIFDMKNRTSQTEKMLEDRKSWVDVTFQKGKLAYNQGRFKDAAAEWNTLLPFIENGDALKAALGDFERNLQVSLDSSKIAEETAAKKSGKFQAPEELGVLLTQLNDRVKNEALEAGAEKIKAEQTYSERQKWVAQTYDLGKSFYEQGKMGEAIGEWSKLGPFLDEKSGMRQLLDAVKQNYESATLAKKGAVEAAANDYQGLKLPYADQMTKLLAEADAKLKGEARLYQTKQAEVEKTLAERQEWSVTTFNKGKVFYDQGQFDEALNQWERLLPYLAEGSDLKRQIQSLRTNYSAVMAGKTAVEGPAADERPVTLKNEEELLSVLGEANAKLRAEAEEMHAKAASSEKVIRDRQEWIQYTFQKGKAYYDQGNYAKAVEEWGILGPYLTEHPKVRESIEEAKKNYSEGKLAQKVIENVEAKKASLMPLPQNAQVPPAAEAPASAPSGSVPASADGAVVPATAAPASAALVSGEIVSIDAGQRTLALKLYSESGAEETLTVSFDESTQIDGSDATAISSIQSGSNIDLRYNPQTSRAVYIYVY